MKVIKALTKLYIFISNLKKDQRGYRTNLLKLFHSAVELILKRKLSKLSKNFFDVPFDPN